MDKDVEHCFMYLLAISVSASFFLYDKTWRPEDTEKPSFKYSKIHFTVINYFQQQFSSRTKEK
jgi:hypothetical protein